MTKLINNTSWIIFATGLSKVFAIVAQVILGFYLDIESFGIYAFALGLASIFIWLRNGAITQLIVKKSLGENFKEFEYFNYAKIFDLISTVGLLLFAIIYYGNSISLIIFSFAFYQYFSSLYLKIRIKCTKENNFKTLAIFEISQSSIRNIVLIISAIYLKDETAFAYSLFSVALFDIVVSHKVFKIPLVLFPRSIKFYRIKRLFINAKWLMIGTFASSFIMQGSFAIIGILTTQNILGIYFFAFQLVTIVSILVGEAIRKVLMPSFHNIKSKELRFQKFESIIKIGIIILIPISCLTMLSVEPILHIIWKDKWIEAIIPGMIMSTILFIPILVVISYSLLEANNQWKKRNLMQVTEAMILIFSAVLGAISNSVLLLTVSITIGKFLSGIMQLLYVYRLFSLSLINLIKLLIFNFFINFILVLLLIKIGNYLSLDRIEELIIIVLTYLIYISFSLMFIVKKFKNKNFK